MGSVTFRARHPRPRQVIVVGNGATIGTLRQYPLRPLVARVAEAAAAYGQTVLRPPRCLSTRSPRERHAPARPLPLRQRSDVSDDRRPDRDVHRTTPRDPGDAGVEQLGFCVPDLEVATRFFENVLGFERFFDAGPYADPASMSMATHYNLDPRAVINTIRLFRGPNVNIELFDCVFPGQDREWTGFTDVGGWHLGLYVDDPDAAIEYLAAKGVRPVGGKKDLMGPEAGGGLLLPLPDRLGLLPRADHLPTRACLRAGRGSPQALGSLAPRLLTYRSAGQRTSNLTPRIPTVAPPHFGNKPARTLSTTTTSAEVVKINLEYRREDRTVDHAPNANILHWKGDEVVDWKISIVLALVFA